MDEILEILYKNKPKKIIKVSRKLGKSRKDNIEKYGYSVKNAAHCVRLLLEGIEILSTGSITFPRPNDELELLISIRNGKICVDEIDQIFMNLNNKLDDANNNCSLPESFDDITINNLLISIIKELA